MIALSDLDPHQEAVAVDDAGDLTLDPAPHFALWLQSLENYRNREPLKKSPKVYLEGGDRDFLVEVKYRPSIEQFISVENQRGERSIFLMARRQWPSLYFVLVTERPEPGRSCFQTVAFETLRSGEPFRTVDLTEVKEFGLFPHNVEDHEELVRRILALLTS